MNILRIRVIIKQRESELSYDTDKSRIASEIRTHFVPITLEKKTENPYKEDTVCMRAHMIL